MSKEARFAKIWKETGPGSEAKAVLGSPRPRQVKLKVIEKRGSVGLGAGLVTVTNQVLAPVGRWGLLVEERAPANGF